MMHKPVFLVVHPLESGKWGYNPVVESVEGITQEAGAFFFFKARLPTIRCMILQLDW